MLRKNMVVMISFSRYCPEIVALVVKIAILRHVSTGKFKKRLSKVVCYSVIDKIRSRK